MPKALDLTGQKFGKLTAIKRLPSRNGKTYWLCKCDCGNQTQVQTGHLRSGAIISCGCAHVLPKKTSIMDSISDEEFVNIVNSSQTYKEIALKCGYSNYSGASCNIVKKRIARQKIDFISTAPERNIRNEKDIFIEDSPVSQSTLRKHYLDGKYSEYKCSICGQEPFWNGKELTLTLDHINGHNRDDRLENLRWVCPNCDRQLDTFSGKNTSREKRKNFCIDCGKEILLSSTRCPECANKINGLNARKVQRPDRETLKKKIRVLPFLQIGKEYGVSDNAIRKWCDEYQLPRTKKEISKYSDEEWEKI